MASVGEPLNPEAVRWEPGCWAGHSPVSKRRSRPARTTATCSSTATPPRRSTTRASKGIWRCGPVGRRCSEGYVHDEDRYLACFAGGCYWFVGRADDVIKSAGDLIGPFLTAHPVVIEVGVIGVPDPVAGEVIKAFVSLRPGHEPGEDLRRELIGFARSRLGAAVAPRDVAFDQRLQKRRPGRSCVSSAGPGS